MPVRRARIRSTVRLTNSGANAKRWLANARQAWTKPPECLADAQRRKCNAQHWPVHASQGWTKPLD
eukprot:6945908-Alexandrium_andersonii.AAC.1